MISLDKAIKHAEDVAMQKEDDAVIYSNFKNHRKNLYEKKLAENAEKECRQCAEDYKQFAEWLKELKQLREQTRWISVSERLPKIQNYSDYYLVTLKSGVVNIAMFIECDGKHWWTSYSDVIAWMPLPEPYKAESEE